MQGLTNREEVANSREPAPISGLIFGGLCAGTLDIISAFLMYAPAVSPSRILRFIASGLLGRRAFEGGSAVVLLGLLLQFIIALSASAVFLLLSRRAGVLSRRPWFSGILYGFAVFAFMSFVVVPLSLARSAPQTLRSVLSGLTIHALCVGLPISLTARAFSGRRTIVLGLSAFVLIAPMVAAELAPHQPPNPVPIVVELFTSDGCSSCPPADTLLSNLDQKQPLSGARLLVVSEHVDYWNRPEWTDPNSSPVYSGRQSAYAKRLHGGPVYTPQMVVDGSVEFVGNDVERVSQALRTAVTRPKIPVAITVTKKTSHSVTFQVSTSQEITANLVAIAALDHVTEAVRGGENGGRTLNHVAVAFSVKETRNWRSQQDREKEITLPLRDSEATGVTRVMVLLQEDGAGSILGAAELQL